MKTTAPVEIYGGNDAALSAQLYANQAAASAEEAAAEAAAAAESAAYAAAYALEALSTIEFTTATVLLADLALTYNPGTQGSVVEGSYVRVRKGGIVYQVQAASASSYHVITAGGVKMNVIPGVKGYNVWAWGALGDGATNDTTPVTNAVTAGWTDRIPVYFPAGTFRVNLSLSGSNATWGARIQWNGEGRSLTILKAFSNASDTVSFTTSDETSFQKFTGIQFDGNAGAANCAFRIDNNHFSVYEDCQFVNAWIGFRHERSFGGTFRNCQFGVGCSYGYYGLGSGGVAYCGFHTFSDGNRFRGSKVAYLVDNLDSPSGAGAGNIHDRSDWETVVGLSVFMRNQGVSRTEIWRNCWFESNATSGTVDVSDLSSPTSALGTLTIPPSGIIIHSGTTSSSTSKKSRLVVEGRLRGADTLGDIDIIADAIGDNGITRSASLPYALTNVKTRLYDPFSSSQPVVNAEVDQLDYFNLVGSGTYSGRTWGGLSPLKSEITYNQNLINRFVCANIDAAGASSGFVFSGAGTVSVVTTHGGLLGRAYQITLNPGEVVEIVGSYSGNGANSRGILQYNTPGAFSFAIMGGGYATAATPFNLSLNMYSNAAVETVLNDIEVHYFWRNFNCVTTTATTHPGLKNNGGSAVTFYLTDLQAVDADGPSVTTRGLRHDLIFSHINSRQIAGALTSGRYLEPRYQKPYILAQSHAAVSVGAVTTEAVLATITVPAGAMGANGSVEITTHFNTPAGVASKTMYVRAGGPAGTLYMNITNTTAQLGMTRKTIILNNNSQSAQKATSPAGQLLPIGNQYTVAGVTSAVNTANAWDIVIAGQKVNAADTLTLEGYTVVINYAP